MMRRKVTNEDVYVLLLEVSGEVKTIRTMLREHGETLEEHETRINDHEARIRALESNDTL